MKSFGGLGRPWKRHALVPAQILHQRLGSCFGAWPPLRNRLANRPTPDVFNTKQQLPRPAVVPPPRHELREWGMGSGGCSEEALGSGEHRVDFRSPVSPPWGWEAPARTPLLFTKTGGAVAGNTKHRGQDVHERSRAPTNTNHALNRTQARHPQGDTRERTPGPAMLQAGVTTAGVAIKRAGDAHALERCSDTEGRPPTSAGGAHALTGESPRGHEWAGRRHMGAWQRAGAGGPLAEQRCHPQDKGARAARGCAHKETTHSRAGTRRGRGLQKEDTRQKGHTHSGGRTKAATHTPPRAPATHPMRAHRRHHSQRRAHNHTHHTPTEGVWRAPLPDHLGCSATR